MSADILLDSSCDIGQTPSGDIALTYNNGVYVQRAINNIRTIYGEYFMDTKRGNMSYNRRMKLTESTLRIIEQDCKDAILYDPEVTDVPSIIASYSGQSSCTIDFTITVVDNTKPLSGSVTILV
jgi:hypothetical protein